MYPDKVPLDIKRNPKEMSLEVTILFGERLKVLHSKYHLINVCHSYCQYLVACHRTDVMLTKRDRPIGKLAASNQQCVDQSESSATTTPALEGCVTCVTALLTTLCGKNSKVNIGPLL